jgi:uncharacterized protein
MTRRKFIAGAAASGGLALFSWAHWFEPELLMQEEYELSLLPPGASSIRLAHLSDLHAWDSTPIEYLERAIAHVISASPDLIAITGDFITRKIHDPGILERVLAKLSKSVPVHAVLGNHDGGAWSRRAGGYEDTSQIELILENAGIEVIKNNAKTVAIRETQVDIVGVGDLWANECNPQSAFDSLISEQRNPRILLSHNPDSKRELADYDWDVMLSGHTHGAQFIMPVLGYAPFAPVRDKRYLRGLFDWNGRYLHVSAGIGNLHGLRFNSPPAFSVLTLKATLDPTLAVKL